MLKRIRSLWRALRSRRDFEEGMAEELRFHIDQYTEDLIRSGLDPAEAKRRASIEFGSMVDVEEDCRRARWLHPFDELARELRFAARLLRKTPGFTATALVTLAICLGANLTMFAVIDSILLRPLPFPGADRLVTVFNTYPKAGVERDGSSITNYYERRGHIAAFSSLSLYSHGQAIVGETGSTQGEPITWVSPDFFATLGVGPVIGRVFTEEETTFQTDKVVILTDSYWRGHFDADPGVIGRSLRVEGMSNTVVGVLPPGFRFLSSEARLYFPLSSRLEDREPEQRHSGGNFRHMIARLKPGATIAQAQAQIDAHNAALEKDNPMGPAMAEAGFQSVVVSLHGDHVATIRPTLLSMQAGAFALLLIGAVNLMNLLLIRANGRVQETALRRALGANRRHIVSEVIVETTLVTLFGGLLGLAAGAGGIRLLSALGADRLPLGAHIAFDGRLAGVALLGTVLLGLALAAPIAFFNLRGDPARAIQSETRGGTPSRTAQGFRHGFVVAQVALALILLAGAGLLTLSLGRAMKVSPGYQADRVLTGQVSVPWSDYSTWPARLAFSQSLLKEIAAQPSVVAVGAVSNVPLSGNSGKSAATIKGRVRRAGEAPRGHYSYGVDGDYFAAMGFSLLEGRFLTASDVRRPARVCVVDEDFARYYWPDSSPVGQLLFEGSQERDDREAYTVVGVVGAVKQAGLTEEAAQGAVYYPNALRNDSSFFVVARTSLPPESFGPTLRSVLRHVDPNLPLTDLRSMEARATDSLVAQRSAALLASVFSLIALLLTAVGTYGVLSYAVAQRRREIGVRMALGARPGQIRGHFFSMAIRLLALGATLGILGAWVSGRALRTLLFHVQPFHLTVLAGAVGVIAAVSLVACLVPAHRAARTSPTEALAKQ